MAELLVVNGVCGGTVFFLPDVPTVVGRSPECHIQIADPWISSMHALFERRGDELWVVDLDSRNGTFVEGQRVHEARIKPGAKVRFGKTSTELRANLAPAEAGAPLPDQRTVVRYVADLATETSAAPRAEVTAAHPWDATGATPTPPPQSPPERTATLTSSGLTSPSVARRQIGIVNEICRSSVGSAGVEDALDRILTVISGALGADHATVLLLDERGEMVPIVSRPPDIAAIEEQSVIETTMRNRAGVLTVDPPPDPRVPRTAAPIRSRICAPVWCDNRVLGVMILDRGSLEPFTAEDLDVATLVGFHAALAVERARAVERAEVREEARQRLLRHLDPAVAARVLTPIASAVDPLVPVAREEAAVLAASISGLAVLAAARRATDVAERTLALQRALAAIARAEGAAVDERIDGGIMAVFGLAQPRPDAAAVALRCARAMLERAAALESAHDLPRLQVKIGVENGRVVTGNFGSAGCPELRTVGDAVDTAVRLAWEAAPGEALAGPGASRRSRRASDEALSPRPDGVGALRIA